LDLRVDRRRREQGPGPVRLGALDLQVEGGTGEELGDRSLPNHLAPIHYRHRITSALDLVEQM
jgi:hypothetical protein